MDEITKKMALLQKKKSECGRLDVEDLAVLLEIVQYLIEYIRQAGCGSCSGSFFEK